jgi:hypothetical protein
MKQQLEMTRTRHKPGKVLPKTNAAREPQPANATPAALPGGSSSTRWSRWTDAVSRRIGFLDQQKLCAAARRRTGLQDFGDPPVEPALSVLTESLEAEAQLHPLGRFLIGFHLRGLLETRLRLAHLWNATGERLERTPIERPVFITGMPRSGSTFLHELLAEDPDNRAPKVWEVMFPVAESNLAPKGRDPRIARAGRCLWCFRRLVPEADAFYPMRAGTPHECVAIHSYSFLSEEFISTCRVASYEAFLRRSDLRPAYRWERRFLQHLQLGTENRRWVLKSPDHVQSLEELFAVFPDALIIQTHRNPLEVLNSSCQLTEALHRLYGRADKHEDVILHESRVLAEGVARAIAFRDAHPELANRFVDVKYTDLVADPLTVVQRVYQQFEMPLTATAVERMRRLAGCRTRYPKHRASAALPPRKPPATADARFAQYCARFGISLQTPQLR